MHCSNSQAFSDGLIMEVTLFYSALSAIFTTHLFLESYGKNLTMPMVIHITMSRMPNFKK